MNIVFNELARDELNDTINFYNLELSGLGQKFKEEIKKALKRIVENPTAWPSVTQEIKNMYCINSRIKFCIPLKKTIFTLLQLLINTENQRIGSIDI